MKYFLRRIVFYVITAWAAITINFFIPRMMDGDPVSSFINKNQGRISSEARESLYVLFGLDSGASLWEQYVDYWKMLFSGDLGLSIMLFPSTVSEVIAQALPWTIGLVGIATVISFLLGSFLGVVIGWRRGSWADGLLPITTFFSSVPYFWLGLVAIMLFSVTWSVFPSSGAYQPGLVPGWSWEFISSVIEHGTLPAITIVLSSVAGWILGMRNMTVTVTSEDYVTVAQAKGLSERRVMFGYAARNAILPQVSGFALSLGFIVSGTLVMEKVFSYQGVGFTLLQAIGAHDYPLMQGIFLMITLSVLVANILADLAYVVLDPRTRQEG
ncbi:ABC transporter permease [Oerskovia jenensis]|uniref:Peptide/nickel transport system permease protein n=1 Tax=Oerskovia jenensis TaxID=162169 RepID=A0ABS2LE15_9CELL|nr:ABC transporter permease [Oerskovia jenensis]MBM7478651.1 peptide/nickel transport system permease protein [Oerskovia jenensis]